jgi:two-component system, LytTR family, sensor kinase
MRNVELHYISKLSSYTWKHVFFRLVMVSFSATMFLFLAINLAEEYMEVTLLNYLQVILIFNIISESNVLLDHLGERFLPIPENIKTRIVLHLLLSLIIGTAAVFYFSQVIIKDELFFTNSIVQLMIFFGLIFIFILILVSITLRIIEKWIHSVRELEQIKSAKLKSDYKSLQDQLNPHFLFNNLSVLKSMIIYNPESAVDFTQNFTDVYRYVMKNNGRTTVTLKEEMEFIKAYNAIHKERLGDALEVNISVEEAMLEKEIPPLSLQLLVENAIKHNVALKEDPLVLTITTSSACLFVENNIHPKETTYSTQTGLKNLINRYAILTDQPVQIVHKEKTFSVELPLL